MKAAICDDQPLALEELKKMLKQLPYVKKVHTYSDMENFWSTLKDGEFYDVVFMDIDWKQENQTGIDFAERLYEWHPYTKLIYVTAYTLDFVEDVFLKSSNLSGFLKKPICMEQLERNLEKIQKEQSLTEGRLLIHYRGSHLAIPFQDILYLENKLHKTCVVLKGQEYLCNEKLETLKEQLDDRFLNCHKSYAVNMQHIQLFQGKEIFLDGERKVPVSKARAKEAKERFFAYISGRM